MITHRILEDYCDHEFTLYAIRSNAEDYSLAYALNKTLKLRLKRSRTDLKLLRELVFPIFEWKDEINEITWQLMGNVSHGIEKTSIGDLFPEEPAYSFQHILPEHKEADYLLKVDCNTDRSESEIVKAILSIPTVITTYEIETKDLKSKQNLIFE